MARKTPASDQPAIPLDLIEPRIYVIREQKVMVDSHLAELYGETTARLNQRVRRNLDRFPQDFAFQLTREEFDALMLRIATSKAGRGGRRKRPWVFTEHGILMLSSVLRSERAVQVNIAMMRAFVRLRATLATHEELARKLEAFESKLRTHDVQIDAIFGAIRKLMAPSRGEKERRIGFRPKGS